MQREISINQPQLTQQRDLVATLFSTIERKVTGLCGCWHSRMSWPITGVLIRTRGKRSVHFTASIPIPNWLQQAVLEPL